MGRVGAERPERSRSAAEGGAGSQAISVPVVRSEARRRSVFNVAGLRGWRGPMAADLREHSPRLPAGSRGTADQAIYSAEAWPIHRSGGHRQSNSPALSSCCGLSVIATVPVRPGAGIAKLRLVAGIDDSYPVPSLFIYLAFSVDLRHL